MRAGIAIGAGRMAASLSRRLGVGAGSIIAGRVALAVEPRVLEHLVRGRTVVMVTGTNGKTTTSHLLAAALSGDGPVAHNASGSNMLDGLVTALIHTPHAARAVLEIDELHLSAALDHVEPDALVVLNLSRDQLDRVSEVRQTAQQISCALAARAHLAVVANADDPLVVRAVSGATRPVWVAGGTRWLDDTRTCPRCGHMMSRAPTGKEGAWSCRACGFARPTTHWSLTEHHGSVQLHGPRGEHVEIAVVLPGRVNQGNAAFAIAAAATIGVEPDRAAALLATVAEVDGRYAARRVGGRTMRLLLVKNPAGWIEALDMLGPPSRPLLVAVNAREADGRDVSWLWDLPVAALAGRRIVLSGERAADLGVRLSYAGIEHDTEPHLATAIGRLPDGEIDVVANYTAFRDLDHHLGRRPADDTDPDPHAGARRRSRGLIRLTSLLPIVGPMSATTRRRRPDGFDR